MTDNFTFGPKSDYFRNGTMIKKKVFPPQNEPHKTKFFVFFKHFPEMTEIIPFVQKVISERSLELLWKLFLLNKFEKG